MFEKLEELYKKYLELTKLISDPEVIADQNSWRKYVKEQSQEIKRLRQETDKIRKDTYGDLFK